MTVWCVLGLVAVLAGFPGTGWAAVWYVDAGNSGSTQDGTSWATAFADIQSAVTAASGDSGGDVWVAAGTYTGSADEVVAMAANVHVYGGFDGTETQLGDRDYVTNVTAIDGEDARRGVAGAESTTLDGFTIRRGAMMSGSGAGLDAEEIAMTVANCSFVANNAEYGGAITLWKSTPVFTNCRFLGNTAGQNGGAIICGRNTTATFTDCLFAGNSAEIEGGAICVSGSTVTLTVNRCAFATNDA